MSTLDNPGPYHIPFPARPQESHQPNLPVDVDVSGVLSLRGGEYRRHLQTIVENPILSQKFAEQAPIFVTPSRGLMTVEWNGFERKITHDASLETDWRTTFANIKLFEQALKTAGLWGPAEQFHELLALVIHKQETDNAPMQMRIFLQLLVEACNGFCRSLVISLSETAKQTPGTNARRIQELEIQGSKMRIPHDATEWRMEDWNNIIQGYAKEMSVLLTETFRVWPSMKENK